MNINRVLDIFLSHFDDFAKKSYNKLLTETDHRYTEQLYHYTSLNSLQNIIHTSTFNASSIYMLNDPNELVLGYSQISEWFFEHINFKIKHQDRFKSLCGFPAFVFCLTELDDDMNFWDKYGDKHKGVRIGFTPGPLKEYWEALEGVHVILAPVIYQNYDKSFSGDYSNFFSDFRKLFIKDINELLSPENITHTDSVNLAYCSSLIASFIKRKEWSSEKEWRILCVPNGPYSPSITSFFADGKTYVSLQNKTKDTLKLLTNKGHKKAASKDVIKIGSLAGNTDQVEYAIKLLFKQKTGLNYFDDVITQSIISTR